MIEKISIRKIASYDESGIVIDNLSKINIIYGANGSGKTTISKYMADISRIGHENCSISWINNVSLQTLVYNKEFRENNFGKSDIAGIFTLGQATKEEIEKINQKKIELDNLKKEVIARIKSSDKLKTEMLNEEEDFKELIWKVVYKKNEVSFKEAFKGAMTKDGLKEKVLSITYNELKSYTLDELEEKAKTIFGLPPEKQDMINIIINNEFSEIECDEVWKVHVVGKQDVNISKLVLELGNGDWVNEGRKYIGEAKTCPFCQRETIDDEFRRQISAFFDEEFENKLSHIKTIRNRYTENAKQLIFSLENVIASVNSKNVNCLVEYKQLSEICDLLKVQINSNVELMNKKIKEPGFGFEIKSTQEYFDNAKNLIKIANEKTAKHNAIVEHLNEEKKKLTLEVWDYLFSENKSIIDAFNKKMAGLKNGINKIDTENKSLMINQRKLEDDIRNESKNITSVQPSVDEINRILNAYGFTNFVIVPSSTKQNYYQILREDGSLAETTLSEGEITFITFLYFLQWAKGSVNQQDVTNDKVLVVDDPISSLDSSILFLVSSLLKDILNDIIKGQGIIKQAIILTHNIYFHKEISFFGNGDNLKKEIHYWILRKKNNCTNIQYYDMKNPINSSYELLWKELKEVDRNSGTTIQNIMRRIVENYFKILGKYKDEDLIRKFPDYESQEVCRSLLCWINDGSHCITDDLFVESVMDISERYCDVFRRIFEYTGHIEHYNMMMGIVNEVN